MEIKYKVAGKEFAGWGEANEYAMEMREKNPDKTYVIMRGVKYTHAKEFEWVAR